MKLIKVPVSKKSQTNQIIAYLIAAALAGLFLFALFYVFFIHGGSPFNLIFNRHRFEVNKLEQFAYSHAFAQDFKKARPELEKLIRMDPDNTRAHQLLGFTYARTGEVDKAIAEFNKVIELDPRFHEAYTNLGVISEKRGADAIKIKKYNEKALSIENKKEYQDGIDRVKQEKQKIP